MGCLHALSPGSAETQISQLCTMTDSTCAQQMLSSVCVDGPGSRALSCQWVTQRPELVLSCSH